MMNISRNLRLYTRKIIKLYLRKIQLSDKAYAFIIKFKLISDTRIMEGWRCKIRFISYRVLYPDTVRCARVPLFAFGKLPFRAFSSVSSDSSYASYGASGSCGSCFLKPLQT